MKTAEEILRQLVKERCPDNLKPYTDEDFKRWMDDDKKDGEVIIQAMRDFASQEVEAYKQKILSALHEEFAAWHYEDIKKVIDKVK